MQACTASTVWYAWGHINSFCSHLWFPVSLCLPHKSWPEAAASSFPCENWLALPKRPWLNSTTIPSSPARCPRGLVLHYPHCLAHFNSSLWAYLLSHTLEIDTQLFYMLLDRWRSLCWFKSFCFAHYWHKMLENMAMYTTSSCSVQLCILQPLDVGKHWMRNVCKGYLHIEGLRGFASGE